MTVVKAVIKVVIFIASLLAIPMAGFLASLYIVFDMVHSEQERNERGM